MHTSRTPRAIRQKVFPRETGCSVRLFIADGNMVRKEPEFERDAKDRCPSCDK